MGRISISHVLFIPTGSRRYNFVRATKLKVVFVGRKLVGLTCTYNVYIVLTFNMLKLLSTRGILNIGWISSNDILVIPR